MNARKLIYPAASGHTETYYCHYTICDQLPGNDSWFDTSMWHIPTDEEQKVLDQIPMDGDTFVRGALEIPVLGSDCQFRAVRILFQKSDNNGCSVFACKNKYVVNAIIPDYIRMNWNYLEEAKEE